MSAPLTRQELERLAPQSLSALHRSWGSPDKFNDAQIWWLLNQRVTPDAMLNPWPIGVATVCFDGNIFDHDPEGVPALTFRATDRGEVIDLIAWQPRTGQIASLCRTAFCLGDIDDVFNPATYFAGDCLRVHRTPLDWLKADRDGICIVKPALTYAYLRDAPRLSFTDVELAKAVRAWMQPPKAETLLTIEVAA
jgi:hypothetical protein